MLADYRAAVRQADEVIEARTGPAVALRLAVVAWTRIHGIVSPEIEGAFDSMALDAGLLVDAELHRLVGQRPHRAR